MKLFPTWTRWALVLAALVYASSRVRLPLPLSLLDGLIEEHAPGFSVEVGHHWLRWGDGEVVLEDLVVRWQDQVLLRVERAEADLDLWPGSADFGLPTRVHVLHPDLRADAQSMEAVRELVERLIPEDRPQRRPPAMRFRVEDLVLRATDPAGDRWAMEGIEAEGHMDPGRGIVARLQGETLLPWPGSLDLHVEGGPEFRRWRGALEADLETRPELALLQVPDWDWQGGPLRLSATATADAAGLQDLRTRVDVSLARVAGRTLAVDVQDLRLRVEGDARRGFLARAQGRETHGAVEIRAEVRAPREAAQAQGAIPLQPEVFAAWRLHAVVDAPDLYADEAAIAWLGALDPTLTEVAAALDSLGIRGSAALQAGIGHRPTSGWHWALTVLPDEVAMNYRGFVEPDGRRLAIPYPVDVASGLALAGGSSVLWDAEARAGFARVASRGTLDFRPTDWSDMDIELSVDGLALDRQAAHAISGNPELAALWREAGSPLGGTLDLQVRLRDGATGFRPLVAGRIRGATGAPLVLPVQTRIEDATFTVRNGIAEFRGRLAALGSTLQANGTLRARADEGWALALDASGSGFRPSAGERLALQHYLRFPGELADVDVYGDLRYGMALRMPDLREPPHMLVSLDLNEAACTQRALELDVERLRGAGTLVSGRGGLGVFLPEVLMDVPGGEARGSLVLHPLAARRIGTLDTGPVELDEELTSRLRQLVGLDLFEDEVGLGGTVQLRATADPMRPDTFRGVLRCNDLLISAADAERGRETFRVEGDIRLEPNHVRAARLHLTGTDTDLWARGVDLRTNEAGDLVLDARLDSASGLRLSSNLPLLLGADALAVLRAIGLDGRARPRDLAVRLTGAGDALRMTLTGEVALDGLAVDTGPGEGLREGRALLRVDEATYRRDDGFRGRVQVTGVEGMLSGLRVTEGTGTLLIEPRSLRLVGFQAAMLGGRLVSDFAATDGTPVEGELSLGLTADGPVHARLAGRDLELDRMREELRTGGSLSGLLDADIDMYGAAARSTALSGGGTVTIRDGVLGTVPVLKNIWAVAGVRPPVFSSGRVVFEANGEDRVDIRELSLEHELLEVRGEGYIRFDTELHLKVTLRTLGPLGRLPVLRDILDWFIEQDVRGPIERPVIYQRSTSKLFNTEPFVPFPLWVPPATQPDWRGSPGIPVLPAAEPRP